MNKMPINAIKYDLLQTYIALIREPYEVCDPYYNPKIIFEVENIDEEFEKHNSVYDSEIKEDKLRYPLILEMQLKKKELEENPIIFDKEETYYETDPHKLVNFDEHFTPFFEEDNNEIFFRNLKDPLRIKWEEIPEIERRLKIVHLEEAVRKLQYDEIQVYCEDYIKSKDLVLLFLQYLPTFWPVRNFINPIKQYVEGLSSPEVYNFFIEHILLLSSLYKIKENDDGTAATTFLYKANSLKAKLYDELILCLKADSTIDILSEFIDKYNLLDEPIYPRVSQVYNFRGIAKLVILFNLSFFNIFPLETNQDFERLREVNKPLFYNFLWYLKDLRWKDYGSVLKVKNNVDQKFNIEDYPIRIVAFKEYFTTHHDIILKEEVERKLKIYDDEKAQEEWQEDRYRADFYNINKELLAYEKVKDKIRSKYNKLNKSKAEIKEAIQSAFAQHLRNQKKLKKFLFKEKKSVQENNFDTPRTIIYFYINEQIVIKTYDELIDETIEFFSNSLINYGIYNEIPSEDSEFWKEFKKYCLIAINKYPNEIKPIMEFYNYQKLIVEEYLRTVLGFAI